MFIPSGGGWSSVAAARRRIQRVRRWRRQFRRRRRGIELVIKCERENSLANSSTIESFRRFTKLNRKPPGEIRVLIGARKIRGDPLRRHRVSFIGSVCRTSERNRCSFLSPRVCISLRWLETKAIHEKCGDEFWQRFVERMRTHFQNEKFTDAL